MLFIHLVQFFSNGFNGRNASIGAFGAEFRITIEKLRHKKSLN
jgi:hypothetical protein